MLMYMLKNTELMESLRKVVREREIEVVREGERDIDGEI